MGGSVLLRRMVRSAHPTNTTIRAEFFREDLPATALEIFRLVILIYTYPSSFMPSACLPALPRNNFSLFPDKKSGLLTGDIREFPIVLGR